MSVRNGALAPSLHPLWGCRISVDAVPLLTASLLRYLRRAARSLDPV